MPIEPADNSDLNRTTVDEELYAGDVGAVVGGEEYRRLGQIVRRTDPAERNGGDDRGLLLIRHEMGKAGGRRVPGAEHVDADVAALEVDDPGTGKGAHRGL